MPIPEMEPAQRPHGGDLPRPANGFFTDTTVCIGCKACEVACKQWNRLPADGRQLTVDLGDPRRFHHMLRRLKLRSPMSVGVWSLTVFSLPAFVAGVLSLFAGDGGTPDAVRRAAAVGLVPALCAAVYKGVLFSTSAQPRWKDARWLGGYLTSAALMLGAAAPRGLALLLGQDRAIIVLRPALGVLLLVQLVPLGLVIAAVRRDLRRLHHCGPFARAGALAIGGGVLAPLCLLIFAGPTLLLGAVLLMLIGSAVLRFVIVYAPRAVAHS
jgi:hypothetical protein